MMRFVLCGAGDGRDALIGWLAVEPWPFLEAPTADALAAAELAVLLADVRRGLDAETLAAAAAVQLFGIRHAVLAVDGMEAVGFDQARFETAAAAFRSHAGRLGIPHVHCLPVSVRHGDNIAVASVRMPWYEGPSLRRHLDAGAGVGSDSDAPLRLPVRQAGAGLAGGILAGGRVRVGEAVTVLPAQHATRVARIVAAAGEVGEGAAAAEGAAAGEVGEAAAGEAVTLVLADDVPVAEGDVVAAADRPAQVTDQFAARLLWLAAEPLLPGRRYLLRLGTRTVAAEVTELKYRLNVETLEHQAGKTLERGEIGFCNLALDQAVAFDPHAEGRPLGTLLLADRVSGATVAAGAIVFGLRRATNLSWQALDVDKMARARLKGQRPCVVWLTGLSGSGKSTVANLLERKLHAAGHHTYILDGDNVRHGLNKDLGFTDVDRVENIRRIAEVARLFVDAGLIVVTAFISPFRSERRMARELLGEGEFHEIFVDAPLHECERRDPKGLYRKARAGKIAHFTGIDSAYEPPEEPALVLSTAEMDAEAAVEQVIALLRRKGHL